MAITSANQDKILGAIGSLNLIRLLYSKKKTIQPINQQKTTGPRLRGRGFV